jgi:hypothetical protein
MSRTQRIAGAALLVAAALVAGTPALRAQARQLAGFAAGLAREGYDQVSTHEGWLNQGQSEWLSIQLAAGTNYAIAATCDGDCSDLDLKVYNPFNRLVVRDTSTDDLPIVYYRPLSSGRYQIEAVMYRCSVEPCKYRLGVFER